MTSSQFAIGAVAVALAAGMAVSGAQYPRDLAVTAEYKTEAIEATVRMTVHVDQPIRESNHERLLAALRQGGYQAFLPLFQQLPVVGYVQLERRRVELRYARSQPTETGERLVLVSDGPVYFLEGGAVDAKARGGYLLSVFDIRIDASGGGTGTMAAAARVKPDADGNVVVDDYAENPVTLTVAVK